MLDYELAEIYGIETKVFNQAVKRNEERFPEPFRFQLTIDECNSLRSQIVTLKNLSRGQHRKYLPYAFTEQGVDRFLIIDEYDIYHIGASLKDLAKKWFAFSKLEQRSFGLMERINSIIQRKLGRVDNCPRRLRAAA